MPTHHTTEHVPEKKFKSEALLSTLTSDSSKENTPGNTVLICISTHRVWGLFTTGMFFAACRANSTPVSTNNMYNVNSSQPLTSYNLSSLPAGPGAGAGAITMAAAQAVQATAQVRTQATDSLTWSGVLSIISVFSPHYQFYNSLHMSAV